MNRRIVTIVEGHAEAESIPAFLRRVLHDMNMFDVSPDRAIREHRHRLVKSEVFVSRVRMAQHREHCSAVLVVFDADDDAACILGPALRAEVDRQGITTPCRVVLAVQELEAWLIAGVESLRGYRGVPENLSPPDDVEQMRSPKGWLDRNMTGGYKSTIDQLPLLLKVDYRMARQRAPSLDKFLRDVESIVS